MKIRNVALASNWNKISLSGSIKISAVKWLITSKIKVFVYVICVFVYCVYLLCIYEYKHMHVYIYIYIYIYNKNILRFYIKYIYK